MCDRKQYYRPNRFLPISSAAGGGVMSAPPSSVAPPASASLLTRQNLLTNLNFPHSHQATPTSQSHYLTTTPREATPLNNLSASSDATLICRPSPVAMMENNYTNGIPSQHLPGYGNGLTTPPALTGSCYYAHCHCCAPHFPASPPPSHCSASYHCHKHCASSETTSHTYATPVFPNDGFPPSGTTPLSQGSPSAPDRTSLWSLLRAWKTSWRAQAGFAKDAAAPSPPANGAARLPLWCLVLLVLVLAAAVCGTVVFFSVGGTGNSSPDAHRQSVIRSGQDPDTHPPNTKLRVFFGRFLILNRRFTSELNDTSSPEYIRMADNLASERPDTRPQMRLSSDVNLMSPSGRAHAHRKPFIGPHFIS
ncbi:unnamed protein product [Cyprideis torosa]|uniref:Uncharacterized protein n=1 Tax=Cyprideis torosa TaxID=163714 RepID=A0A7R8W6M9_9CRUS|nr:unnamed protein product [Cyprideis torosa]CAG0886617.1 unnamed protein product [Cyprideis torosa]